MPFCRTQVVAAPKGHKMHRAVGAANFLLMGFSQRELVTAIENAAAGKPPPASARFAKVVASMESRDSRAARDAGVTPREEQVLRHVAFGLSNDEIARSLLGYHRTKELDMCYGHTSSLWSS